MPDIQMIMEAPQAMQGSGPAASQGADGGEVFGKALSQAKTTIDEKSTDSPRGRKDSPDSARSEKAAEAKGSHRAKARRQEEGMPNLPTRQPSEKPATNATQNAEGSADKQGRAPVLAEPAPRLKTRREAWAEVGLELPDSLSEGKPLQFWRGDAPSATDSAAHEPYDPQDDQQDPELAIMIQQIVNNVIGDAMQALAPPEMEFDITAMLEDSEPAPQLGDQAAVEKSSGPNDIWYVLDEDGKVIEAKESGANATAGQGAEASVEAADAAAERKTIDAAAERFNAGIKGADEAPAQPTVPAEHTSSKPGQAERREAQGATAPKITHYAAEPDKSENTEKPGADTNAAQDAKAKAEAKAEAKAQANPHHRTQQAGDKSLADAEHALGLRHEMTAGTEEDNAKPAAHFRNGQAPREIESALPKDNKWRMKAQDKQDKAQEQTVIANEADEAKGAKEAKPQTAKGEEAAHSRHAKANVRTQIMESEEGQNNSSQTEKPHSEARQAGHRRGANSAKEAAEEAAARRSASEGNAPSKGTKEPGAAAPRGRRHGPAATSGQDSLNAKASEAAKPAPPPMRMDAAPQARAREEANASSKAAQSGQNNSNGQNSQSAQNSQASQNGQTSQNNNGGQSNHGNQGSGNNLGGQNTSSNQGQSSFAAHRGEGEMAGAKPGAAQAKPFDGSAGHSSQTAAAADSKSTIPSGLTLGGTGQAQAQGHAMPGAPALPGSTEHQQAHAPSAKPQLPPQAPMAQMDGSVKWMLRNDQQAAEIQLYPEHLGKVTIRLRVEGNEVHARVWASEASTLPALREQRAFLESSLKEQGLQLSSFDLQHGKGGQQAQSGEGQNRPQGQNFHFGAQMIESWNGSEFRQELPSQATSQVPAPTQNGGRVELYA